MNKVSTELKEPKESMASRFSCTVQITALKATESIAKTLHDERKAVTASLGACCPLRIKMDAIEPVQNSSRVSKCFPRDLPKNRREPVTQESEIPRKGPQKGINAAARIHNGSTFSINAIPAQTPAAKASR